ncbi:pheromone-regulated membrane protein [Seminavis robusta]|uniref:Pheromone-regulated membrane protein n=1 Tax=Seminavis robusta TaxID=568900 RepID=A0A9N8HGH2_9STRA|nr:pheromone-regulated membrane protein [Seminavis robusta]|eukprot:Sro578_g169770.1 pheromone-regulated membrane protein (875) ;mRNA; r:5096-8330
MMTASSGSSSSESLSNHTSATLPSDQSMEASPDTTPSPSIIASEELQDPVVLVDTFFRASSFSSNSTLSNDNDQGPDLEMGPAPFYDSRDDGSVVFHHLHRHTLSHDIFVVPEGEIKEGGDFMFTTNTVVNMNGILGGEDNHETDNQEEKQDVFASSGSSLVGGETDASARSYSSKSHDPTQSYTYKWNMYAPSTKDFGKFLRWTIVGGSRFSPEQTDEELQASLAGLAQCLNLMRDYLTHYGMPERGGPRDQEYVLREVVRDLYGGGCPLWALEPVMQKAAEGLTGQPNVNWQLYPRKAFVYNPSSGTTSMFRLDRGFNISKMSAMEGVAVRLASFASNVQGVSNIPARFPNPADFYKACKQSVRNLGLRVPEESKLARKILNLASRQQGLFYYVNSREYMGGDTPILDSSNSPKRPTLHHAVEDFWIVTDEERELFSRLACQEALKHISIIDARQKDAAQKPLYSPLLIIVCRAVASAGACAFWFGGSWQDMIVAGLLAIVVNVIGTSSLLNKQERLLYEVVASFVVGLTSGLLALSFPEHMCFSAMAISGILDLLQGFRVVYAVIEIMSRHTVAGGADLLEGVLFTGLISYFLQFGSYTAASILGDARATEFAHCDHGLDPRFYILLVPLTCAAFAIMFTPNLRELPGMAFHGILAYCMNYGLAALGATSDLNYFVSASAVSLSAGLCSRFTGRQAVGNTVAGIYMLLPGAYLVSSIYSGDLDSSFFTDILKSAIVTGIGAWSGTILCSPTLLGTTRGLLWQQQAKLPGLRRGLSKEGDRAPPPSTEDNSRTSRSNRGGHVSFAPKGHHRVGSKTLSAASGHHHRDGSRGSSAQQASTGGHSNKSPHQHHRIESNVSIFDFDHPTSTMLFF